MTSRAEGWYKIVRNSYDDEAEVALFIDWAWHLVGFNIPFFSVEIHEVVCMVMTLDGELVEGGKND